MMLRSLLLAALLGVAGAAHAHGDYGYGRVVTTEPHVSFSFASGRHHDGFRVLYESGGQRYWTHTPYNPERVIVVPQHRYVVKHVYHARDDDGWDDRRHWRKEHRKHDRHHRRHHDRD